MLRSISKFLLLVPLTAVVLAAAPEETPEALVEAAPLDYKALTYFQDSCARCHGSYGIQYDPQHLTLSSAEKLKKVVEEMADGPGQAPISGLSLEAQTAYHRSFIDGKPFVIFNGTKEDNGKLILRGEVTPGSQMQICIGEKSYEATVSDHSWTAEVPPTNLSDILIIATRGETKTELKASAQFSHRLIPRQ